jgi:hypothetical protein
MLELCAVKVSCTVLRRESGRKARDLSGRVSRNRVELSRSFKNIKTVYNPTCALP